MKKYKAWYIPQVPMDSFEVETDNVDFAIKLYETLVKFSIFEYNNKVKPDYSDAGGVCFLNEDGEWEDLENLEGYEDWEDNLDI